MILGIEEIKGAICKMSRGRPIGLDEILLEFWKRIGRASLE